MGRGGCAGRSERRYEEAPGAGTEYPGRVPHYRDVPFVAGGICYGEGGGGEGAGGYAAVPGYLGRAAQMGLYDTQMPPLKAGSYLGPGRKRRAGIAVNGYRGWTGTTGAPSKCRRNRAVRARPCGLRSPGSGPARQRSL